MADVDHSIPPTWAAKLHSEVNELLAEYHTNREASKAKLSREITQSNISLRGYTAQYLQDSASSRVAGSKELAASLRGDALKRRNEVAAYLAGLRQKRKGGAVSPAKAAGENAQIAVLQPEVLASVYPAADFDLKSGRFEQSGPFQIFELVYFLLKNNPEKLLLDELESHFGSSRLREQLDEFINLMDELRPGSKIELDMQRARIM